MRIAPLGILAIVSISCGGPAPESAPPAAQPTTHRLMGDWTLLEGTTRGGIRVELRVDSVARDSTYGRLTFFFAGDAGFLTPDDWGPLVGTVRGDSVWMTVQAGARAPEIALAGRTAVDTVWLTRFRLGADIQGGPWQLVRTTAIRP